MSKGPVPGSILDRIEDKFTVDDGCWEWTAALDRYGYGVATYRGKYWNAHRLVYTEFKGEIPEGMVIDHLCRNRKCVRPDHLEAVTPGENTRRSPTASTLNRQKARCKRGHEFDYVTPDGRRQCRTCARTSRPSSYVKE